MGRRARNSAIDSLIRDWSKVRREILGVDDPELARGYVGAIRSTLGQRRDLHAGSKSNKIEQHYPEVYEGDSRFVNQAFQRMRPELKAIMDVHYCAKAPAQVKADFMALSIQGYWNRVNDVRAFVEGYIAGAV